ncbi:MULTISPECIES: NF041680 family putative transposase [Streptomyces]|uniref:NF041680 family putative transposase n=1 Tax=Streptomyces TaxID=1883 RepID=UPI0018DF2750|nr:MULTISPECIES: NF041680 family putative transposase [Streptomyces]MCZ4103710.1 transposase [Streptomyces sp. H39-C1]
MSVLQSIGEQDAFAKLSRFRTDFYGCLSARADAFFELTDALLCADGPVTAPVELSLTAEHRRGYGSLYAALNHGRLDADRLRELLAGLPLPRIGGRIVLAVDVSPWLRSDAACSPERLFCHVHGRSRAAAQIIPGWTYSIVAALSPGRSSWTAVLDAVRLGPEDDAIAVTADQLRAVAEDLIRVGQWQAGDRDMLIVMDAGYDVMRLAWLLRDLPVEPVGRLRSDRVLRLPIPPLSRTYQPIGRPPKHGPEFRLARPETWPEPAVVTDDTSRYGKAEARAWDRVHPRLTHRSAWIDSDDELPLVEGTLIRPKVDHLPGDRDAPPVWLWSSATGAAAADVDQVRSSYLRRFDLEHTFRLFKQTLGWTRPRLRDPQAADRWTWLVIVAHTQLRLAATLVADQHKPWEKPDRAGALTPTRVRRGFRNIRPHLPCPARVPKPSRPGPGRPPGSKNRHPATRHDVGKTVKRPETLIERDQARR